MVVAAGAIAEVDALTAAEWADACSVVASAVAEGGTLVIGLPEQLPAALACLEARSPDDATALLVPFPAGTTCDAITRHLDAVAEASGRPLVPYLRASSPTPPAEIARLARRADLAGFKDGLRDPGGYRQRRAAMGGLPVAVAWEDMILGYWAYGAEAVCPASGSLVPGYTHAVLALLAESRLDDARRLLDAFGHPFSDLRRTRAGVDLAIVKAALAERGWDSGVVRVPHAEPTPAERERLRALLAAVARWSSS